MDTKHYRESANSSDHFTGPEVRLWVHALCDEIDRLRAQAAASGEPPLFRQYVDQQVAKDMAQLYAAFSGPQPAPALTYAQGWKDGYKHGAWADSAQPAPARVPLTDAQVLDLRSRYGWAKETIRAIDAAINGITGEAP